MELKQNKETQARQGFWRRAAYTVFVLLEVRANRFRLEAKPRKAQERPDGHK